MIAAILALLAGCPDAPPPGCRDDGDCPGLAVCRDDGTCEEVACLENAHCPLEHTCDPAAYTCRPGCDTADDCFAGDTCDLPTGACVPAACTDSQLDCVIGDVCDVDTGRCEDADDLCLACSGDGRTRCLDEVGGICQWMGDGSYCLPPCRPATDPARLPRGFQCLDLFGDGTYHLWGDCRTAAAEDADTGR